NCCISAVLNIPIGEAGRNSIAMKSTWVMWKHKLVRLNANASKSWTVTNKFEFPVRRHDKPHIVRGPVCSNVRPETVQKHGSYLPSCRGYLWPLVALFLPPAATCFGSSCSPV